MTVKELKQIIKNYNDDDMLIGEVAHDSCGGHGMYSSTTIADLISVTTEREIKIKQAKELFETEKKYLERHFPIGLTKEHIQAGQEWLYFQAIENMKYAKTELEKWLDN